MYGKILIRCDLEVRTGMHIGGSSAFSAIGAVDSPVVRDPYTGYPIVPGSSLKGKLRTLLARSTCQDIENMPAFDKDDERILRLFGSSEPVRRSRLQFADAFLSNAKELSNVGVTEVKTENAISRANSVANPRQIERVIAGAKFGVSIVYDVTDPAQVEEDLSLLAKGMKLLQMDYLGGHGSRGSGRVSLKNFALEGYGAQVDLSHLKSLFDEVDARTLLPLAYDDFFAAAKSAMKPRHRAMLHKLLDFHFDRRATRYNLPPNRLKMIEKEVQRRARVLLG